MKIHNISYFEKLKIRPVNVNDLSVNKTLSYVLWMTEIDSAEEFSKRFDGDDLVEVMDDEADSDNFVSSIELNVLTVDEYENSRDFLRKYEYEFDVFASNLSKEETKKHIAKMNASDMFKFADGDSMIVDDHITYIGNNVTLFEKLKIKPVNSFDLSFEDTSKSYVLWLDDVSNLTIILNTTNKENDFVTIRDYRKGNITRSMPLVVFSSHEYEKYSEYIDKFDYDLFVCDMDKDRTKEYVKKQSVSSMNDILDKKYDDIHIKIYKRNELPL